MAPRTGKQLPYVGIALLSYVSLLLMALLLFRAPLEGSLLGLSLGAVLFVFASTRLGLLMSTFVRTQIAAVFGTAIVATLPTLLFSGLLTPVASLTRQAQVMGLGFPSAWFHHVSVGSFTKGLDLADMQLSPTTHFVALSQAVLYRGAGLAVVWPDLLATLAISAVCFVAALARFRRTVSLMRI